MESEKDRQREAERFMAVAAPPASTKTKCSHCNKIGHAVENCWAKNGGKPGKAQKVNAVNMS